MDEMYETKLAKNIFTEGFDYLCSLILKNPYQQKYFQNAELEKLKKLQLEAFTSGLEGNLNNVKRNGFLLGKLHFSLSIPFSATLSNLEKMEYVLIGFIEKKFKEKSVNSENTIRKIERTYFTLRNAVAYGYLYSFLQIDKVVIREKLRTVKYSEEELRFYVKEHLVWLNKIIEDIKKLRKESSVELDTDKCKFARLLEDETVLNISKRKFNVLRDIHDKIHKTAIDIYYSIEERNFINLLLDYINLQKLSAQFLSLLTVKIAVRSVEDANIDPLTGVLNRRPMEFILNNQYQISKISNRPVSIALLDIDNFKNINDTYGHLVGDCVIKQVAYLLQRSLRKSDLIFRFGGEEFLIFMPFTEKKDAFKVMEKLRKKIENKEIFCGKDLIKVTVSVGVEGATLHPNETVNDIIERADKKMLRAKKSGKNKVVI
ncbi:GGDEF domain-containing protein [Persephonella sp.]